MYGIDGSPGEVKYRAPYGAKTCTSPLHRAQHPPAVLDTQESPAPLILVDFCVKAALSFKVDILDHSKVFFFDHCYVLKGYFPFSVKV